MKREKLLVANRGEIACRIIKAGKELGLHTAAVYSSADADSEHVRLADEAHLIGNPEPSESYLSIPKIMDVLKRSAADMVHPGYGFLSENAVFADAVEKSGARFVGPTGKSMRAVGDKLSARSLAVSHGVPVNPGLEGDPSAGDVASFIRKHRFPIMLKASGGGGGRGMRIVRRADDLDRSTREARNEASGAFGSSMIFVEKYIEKAKHVEVQIIGDGKGNCVVLGERECSVQRRHQKLIEESPSPSISQKQRMKLFEWVRKLVRATKYRSAGTFEFILDDAGNLFFLEVNSRLQVEHPVTEVRTGIDIVRNQLLLALTGKLALEQEGVSCRGHAIEVRICAEDAYSNFAPAYGRVPASLFPHAPNVRVDTFLDGSAAIPVYYDSLIAKVIGGGATRDECISRLLKYLPTVIVAGIPTTIPFHIWALSHKEFVSGKYTTSFVEREWRQEVDQEDVRLAAFIAAATEFVQRERYVSSNPTGVNLSAWKTWTLPSAGGSSKK